MPGIEVKTFARDGFVIIPSFFDKAFMDELDGAVNRYIRDVVPGLPPDQVFYEEGGRKAIKSMNRLDEHQSFFTQFKRHPKFLEVVSSLLQSNDIVVENLQFFGKPSFDGSVTPWHQDNGFQNYTPPESVMLWLALDDVSEENGCVTFARGSHLLGLQSHKPSGVIGFSMGAEPPSETECPRARAVMSRGSLSIHHCNTFHSSGANKSPNPRRALAVNMRTSRAQADMEARARIKEEVARLVANRSA